MFTVDADLVAAMATKHYVPYAKVNRCYSLPDFFDETEAIYFELTGTHCIVQNVKATIYVSSVYFTLERGCIIDGVEVGQTTGKFYTIDAFELDGIVTSIGHIFEQSLHISVAGGYDYETVITDIATEFAKTAVFRDDTEDFWGYEFMQADRYVDINNPDHFISLLRQKYLMFCCDNGGDEVKFFYAGGTLSSGDADWTLEPEKFMRSAMLTKRNLIWRDEAFGLNLAYDTGTYSAYPRHNLGYIKTTDSAPRVTYPDGNYVREDLRYFSFTCKPDLRYQDGDILYIASIPMLSRMKIKEIYNARKSPRWQMQITAIQYFQGTEAGNMPAEMIAVVPFIPLYTGEFDNILDEADSYIQHALDTLDDHNHDAAYLKLTGGTLTGDMAAKSDTIYKPQFSFYNYYSGAGPSYFLFIKYRGSQASPAAVQASDNLGSLSYRGFDGTNVIEAAKINGVVDGTPGTNDMPGALAFSTTKDGAAAVTYGMKLDKDQSLSILTGLHVGALNKTPTDNDISCDGTIETASADEWDLNDYTAGAPDATGYVTVTINGTTYKLLAST